MALSFDPEVRLHSMGGLTRPLFYLPEEDLAACRRVSNAWARAVDKSPRLTPDGSFKAKLTHPDGPVFLHMEPITEENSRGWSQFKDATIDLFHKNEFKKFIEFIAMGVIYHPKIEELSGFTLEEYQLFQQELIDRVNKTNGEVIKTLKQIPGALVGFHPEYSPRKKKYIVYATNTPHFSIPLGNPPVNWKQHRDMYPLLISFVRTASLTDGMDTRCAAEHRGITGSPWEILKNRYRGLSMPAHGFAGSVTANFSPNKTLMRVDPLPIMQSIIIKMLQRGEGYLIAQRKKPLPIKIPKGGFQDEFDKHEAVYESRFGEKDLLDHIIDWGRENPTNWIKIAALVRIYGQYLIL